MTSPPAPETTLLDSLSMPILVVARSGAIHYANPAACQFWRMQAEKLGAFTLQRLFGEESQVWARFRQALARENSVTVEPYPFVRGEGRPPLFLRVQIDPVSNGNQPPELAMVAVWDQTHREQVETLANEARLMDSVALMVRGLAHELRNPLGGIKGATQLLARQIPDEAAYREFPPVILRELERLERLVQDFLLPGAEQTLSRTFFNVHELLDTVIWFQRNAGGETEFLRDFDPSMPDLYADQDRLHQVFLNLIRNAVEANRRQGTVTLRTRMSGPWQDRETLPDPAKTYFLIEFEDEGAEKFDPAEVFTPFFTTKKEGLGLGLTLSYRIVRAHHGHLRCRAAVPRGAVFSVILPMVEEP
ncbi:MAG: PAS domain-containing protein, partial [SAR324 cluster bacterium]|nr:PAS domain-containing protein [SAR324 cluster bacterium]